MRKVLTGLNHIESTEGGCGRRVIGVYAGWRGGASRSIHRCDITFIGTGRTRPAGWFQGSIGELLARIRAAQIEGNQRGRQTANPCQAHPVRSLIVGHSFGGLIVYSVLSEALIRDVVDVQQVQSTGIAEPPGITREGDLVLLVNAAIEATKFDPLFRAARNIDKWHRYHAPLFVSVTSMDDLATRMAFPLFGRQISTTFDSYTPDVAAAQRDANLQTLGQDQDYITMELDTLERYNGSVAPSSPLQPAATCAGYEELSKRTDLDARVILAGHIEDGARDLCPIQTFPWWVIGCVARLSTAVLRRPDHGALLACRRRRRSKPNRPEFPSLEYSNAEADRERSRRCRELDAVAVRASTLSGFRRQRTWGETAIAGLPGGAANLLATRRGQS